MVHLREVDDKRDNYLVVHGFPADLRDFLAHLIIVGNPVGLHLEPDGDPAVYWMLEDEPVDVMSVKFERPRSFAGMLHSRAKALEFGGFLGELAHSIGQ